MSTPVSFLGCVRAIIPLKGCVWVWVVFSGHVLDFSVSGLLPLLCTFLDLLNETIHRSPAKDS